MPQTQTNFESQVKTAADEISDMFYDKDATIYLAALLEWLAILSEDKDMDVPFKMFTMNFLSLLSEISKKEDIGIKVTFTKIENDKKEKADYIG